MQCLWDLWLGDVHLKVLHKNLWIQRLHYGRDAVICFEGPTLSKLFMSGLSILTQLPSNWERMSFFFIAATHRCRMSLVVLPKLKTLFRKNAKIAGDWKINVCKAICVHNTCSFTCVSRNLFLNKLFKECLFLWDDWTFFFLGSCNLAKNTFHCFETLGRLILSNYPWSSVTDSISKSIQQADKV